MNVPMTDDDLNSVAGFYPLDIGEFVQTLEETKVLQSFEMGGGVVIHYGTRNGQPAWLMDNPGGIYAAWIEDGSLVH